MGIKKGSRVTLSCVNGVIPSSLQSLGYVSGEFYPVIGVWETAMGDYAKVAFPEGELTFPTQLLILLVGSESLTIDV